MAKVFGEKDANLKELKGKTICIDAFNTLYQFLSSVRQQDGTPLMDDEKRITSHLSGIFYRNISLLNDRLKLIYVFDGEAPALKARTWKKRKKQEILLKENTNKPNKKKT